MAGRHLKTASRVVKTRPGPYGQVIRPLTLPKPVRRLLDHPRIGRFVRYGVGSALASVTSAITLAVVFHALGAGPQVASITAFIGGALVNFLLYRFWAWRATIQETRMTGDVLKFSLVAVATALVALSATTIADHYAKAEDLSGWVRTLVIEGAYFGSFAVMFVAKFLVLDRFVFSARKRSAATEATGPLDALIAATEAAEIDALESEPPSRRKRRSRDQVETTTRA
jgi:putative flippase GtrA